MINFLQEEMDKSREHELKLIQMLNFTGSAPHQQQHAFQSVPSQVTNTQYIEKGSIANYSQSPWHRALVPNMSSQPDFPMASFDSVRLNHQLACHFHHSLHLKTFLMERYTTNCKVPDMDSIFFLQYMYLRTEMCFIFYM